MTLYFREEGVLATHPPSFHPRRVFGYPESEKKSEKMRETGERERRAESFPPKNFINEKKGLPITVHQELIYCPSQAKLQKKQNQKLLQGIKWEENQKGEQKSNGQQEQCRREKSDKKKKKN